MNAGLLGFLLVTLAGPVFSSAAEQSADKIIGRYEKAAGANAYKRITSTVMTGSVRMGEGPPGTFSWQTAKPDRLRIDTQAGDGKASQCYNGKSAWRWDSHGLRTLYGDEAKNLRLHALLANSRLRDLSRNRILAHAVGRAKIEDREVEVVELAMDSVRSKIFFDSGSDLPIKQELQTPDGTEERLYADYRRVDGVMEPFRLRIKNGKAEVQVVIERVEHNRALDEATFRYPVEPSGTPLPDLTAMMTSIVANQEKIEELRERYTFRETEIERKLSGDGRVKETETRLYDVTPVAGGTVRRLVSVNGKELSPSEREKEDRRVQNVVEEKLRQREKQEQASQKARARGDDEDDHDDRITILSFLKISEVTSMRRENFRGHEVIVFDFEPRKGIKPRNNTEKIISKLAGTIWVDEEAKQIARLEARLIDSFKVGGGLLVSISPSTAFAFEQEKVNDEVWLPSSAEATISARVLLMAKLNRGITTRYSDYKKYQVENDYKLKPPETSIRPD